MDHISAFVLVPPACVLRSIVTDGSGQVLHWIMCMNHGAIELCADPTCALCQRLGITHGDSTEERA